MEDDIEQPRGHRDWAEDSDLWDHQGQALTVGRLRLALSQADDELRVVVDVHDGTVGRPTLTPVEIGFMGEGAKPEAIVITVTDLRQR